MNKLWGLWLGEITRLWRYKITLFGLIVSAIWLVIILLVSKEEANALLPQLLILDSGLMSIILLAAAYYYEKQEGTIKAVLVSPTKASVLLTAKVLGTLLGSVISLLLLWLTMGLVHGAFFPLFPALGMIILVTLAHVSIGYVLIYLSADFMDLLIKYTGVVLVLFVPIILVNLDLIPEGFSWIALLSPTYAGQYLIGHLWQPLSLDAFVIAFVMLIIFPATILPLYVLPKFRQEAIRA
jgi:fluoroquinolone transport system permease protein